MDFETPSALLGRLKLGREEFLQRLLTTLILHAPYPRWNTRSAPGVAGVQFLHDLYGLVFGSPWPGDALEFVDEFELLARTEMERGGAPDYAVLWPDRIWLIELKTERGSHRRDQIPLYFALAHHHYPNLPIDVLYLTPPMNAEYEPVGAWARYAHLAWPEVVPLLERAWPAPTEPGQSDVCDGVLETIANLDLQAAAWRARVGQELKTATFAESAAVDPVSGALALASLTAADGMQRAFNVETTGLEELIELRSAVRNALANSPQGSDLRHVLPWIWRWESGGEPLTPLAQEVGRELRLSRYELPQY